MDDTLEVQFLGGQHRETVPQIEPRLRTEYRDRPCTGAVLLALPVFQHMPE